MNLTLVLSIACMLIGLVVYLLATPAKPAELGRLTFFAGLLAFLLTFSGAVSIVAHG